jgi:predicted DNA binding CopG/RHH family protein
MKNSKKVSSKKSDPLNKDLSSIFDKKGWKKVQFELRPKKKSITIRISEEMLDAIKSRAEDEGLDYQKWIRSSIEEALNRSA